MRAFLKFVYHPDAILLAAGCPELHLAPSWYHPVALPEGELSGNAANILPRNKFQTEVNTREDINENACFPVSVRNFARKFACAR